MPIQGSLRLHFANLDTETLVQKLLSSSLLRWRDFEKCCSLRSCRDRDLTGFLRKVLRCSRNAGAFERWLRTSYMVDCEVAYPREIGFAPAGFHRREASRGVLRWECGENTPSMTNPGDSDVRRKSIRESSRKDHLKITSASNNLHCDIKNGTVEDGLWELFHIFWTCTAEEDQPELFERYAYKSLS